MMRFTERLRLNKNLRIRTGCDVNFVFHLRIYLLLQGSDINFFSSFCYYLYGLCFQKMITFILNHLTWFCNFYENSVYLFFKLLGIWRLMSYFCGCGKVPIVISFSTYCISLYSKGNKEFMDVRTCTKCMFYVKAFNFCKH